MAAFTEEGTPYGGGMGYAQGNAVDPRLYENMKRAQATAEMHALKSAMTTVAGPMPPMGVVDQAPVQVRLEGAKELAYRAHRILDQVQGPYPAAEDPRGDTLETTLGHLVSRLGDLRIALTRL